jgi:predicted secreted protein
MRYLIVLSLLFITPACAADTAHVEKGTVVSLTASSATKLANDEVVVNYRIEAEGKQVEELQMQVNNVSHRVNAVQAKLPGLKQQTTGRSLQAVSHYDKTLGRQVRDGWRLVQSEQAISHDLAGVAQLVDGIEKAGAHLDRLSFRISDSASEAAMETLRMQAVQKLRNKATAMAKALDAPSFRILRLNSDSRIPPVPVMQRGMMTISTAEAAPSFNIGESELSVTVSGEILLPEKSFSVK